MFDFFKKKPKEAKITFNYGSIVVDMHSHVLPGIDDGAQTVQDSVILIRKMMDVGIKKIIATPHIMADYYRNTPETIGNALEILKAELEREQIDMVVEAAAEHYFDETFEARIKDHKLMTMVGNYVLFEFSFINSPPNYFNIIQSMINLGYKPILAHPERYTYMTMDSLVMLRNWGCSLQLNTISLTGYYGPEIKKRAEEMVDKQMIDFISSDMHHLRHAEAFHNALATLYLKKLIFDYPLKNILLK